MPRLSMVVALMLVVADCTHSRACATRHRQDFSAVAAADRIEVRDTGARVLVTITDAQKVRAAASFITERSDDYSEVLAGTQVPKLQLEFFRGSAWLNGFGIAPTYLTDGSLSRPTPPDQIDALMRQLELQWPKP